jgi:putative ABC transport system permease protein
MRQGAQSFAGTEGDWDEDNTMTGGFKSALRHFLAQKIYSGINIFGLSVGLASFLFIVLFVRHELSFDRFHPAADRLYRLSIDFDNGDRFWASNQYHLVPAINEDFAEIEQAARVLVATIPVRRGIDAFNEAGFRLVDPELFQLFSFTWLQGDASSALARPFTLVLTQSAARRYFGDEDPLGQTLEVNNQAPMTVTGVIRDLPDNTHLSGDIFTAMSTGVASYGEQALSGTFDFHSYVRLREGVDIATLVAPLSTRLTTLMPQNFGAAVAVRADPITDIHFNPLRNEMPGTPGSLAMVYSFSAIALGIIFIACANFMNLSTARSSLRAREVGVRKSIGAAHRQLITRFLAESLGYAALAMVLAVALVELLLPAFRNFVGKDMQMDLYTDAFWPPFLLGLVGLLGVVAGSYPAFFLARFKAAKVLKGELGQGNAGILFRNLLVIFQFSISIALIAATALIHSQMQYARNVQPGYDKDGVVVLNGSVTQALGTQWEAMKQQLLTHPGIAAVTASRIPPGVDNFSGNVIWHEGAPEGGTAINFLPVDFGFFETYGIEVISGRTFQESLATDRMRFPFGGQQPTAAWMLNEAAARMLGWSPDEALNKNLSWGSANGLTGPVIGVVADVFYESARSPLKPMLYMVTASGYGGASSPLSLGTASIKLADGNQTDALAHIDRTWAEFMPGLPIDRYFLSSNFDSMYLGEQKEERLLAYFSALAVFIACLGLYGLATFNAQRRVKEIGVRKVMGGSVWSIVLLLTNDFSKLVLISNVLAWPVAYFAMERWLQNFAYRIDLTPLVFVGSGMIALCIAWVTVGGTAAKAASQKPVLALRYE